jgi:hypothetical protein
MGRLSLTGAGTLLGTCGVSTEGGFTFVCCAGRQVGAGCAGMMVFITHSTAHTSPGMSTPSR